MTLAYINTIKQLSTTYATRVSVAVLSLCTIAWPGCIDPASHNAELQHKEPLKGYRFDLLKPGAGNTDELFVCITFSGGGTRAAALAYGVLNKLQNVELEHNNTTNRRVLLDEVDIISSVSGGSFTAAAYGLWREKLFDSEFKAKFLYNDIQGVLLSLVLRPLNLLLLPYVVLDRIDIAATYYDEVIFNNKSYADFISRNTRPFVVLSATNLAIGQRFEFTQDDFDVLGSDLASVPIASAVAASSAFPILLSPLRLAYYANDNSTASIQSVQSAMYGADQNRRQYVWTKSLLAPPIDGRSPPLHLDESRHKFLYLVDGGLADNLGLTYIIQAYRWGVIRRRLNQKRIKRLVVIVVDAGIVPPQNMESKPRSPGIFKVGIKTGTTSMDNFSATLIEVMKHLMIEEPRQVREAAKTCRENLGEHCPEALKDTPKLNDDVERYLIVLNFDKIQDYKLRKEFNSLSTNFFLPRSDVDDLIKMGGHLLENNAEFQRLLSDLREDTE